MTLSVSFPFERCRLPKEGGDALGGDCPHCLCVRQEIIDVRSTSLGMRESDKPGWKFSLLLFYITLGKFLKWQWYYYFSQ